MELRLPFEKTPEHWKSQSRIAGEASEIWCSSNVVCPFCGGEITDYKTNYPVKDFFCENCGEEFQLKASKSITPKSGTSITSSSFERWYNAILDGEQPNLLILKYKLKKVCKIKKKIENSFEIDKNTVSMRGHRIFNKNGFVEKVFLVEKSNINQDCLEKRNKLSKVARRNGWQGSYLKIQGDKFRKIFDPEEKDVCQI